MQERICSSVSKDFMDSGNPFFMEQMGILDSVVRLLNQAYFTHNTPTIGGLVKSTSPARPPGTSAEEAMNTEFQLVPDQPSLAPVQSVAPQQLTTPDVGGNSLRDSLLQNIKSPPLPASAHHLGGNQIPVSPQIGSTTPAMGALQVALSGDP